MKVYFDSLGCPKALVDAERMSYHIVIANNEIVFDPKIADAIVINTCAFIDDAKKESIDTILYYTQLKESNPSLKIIVAGCLSERYKEELFEALPEVDSMIGVKDPKKIVEALSVSNKNILDTGVFRDNLTPGERNLIFSGYHYAYLKISEGCSRDCSFCIIPSIRGSLRSFSIDNVIKEAEFLRKNSVEEIIIISEDITSFGTDTHKQKMIIPLLKEISNLGFEWIRLLYLFPDEIIYDITALIAEDKHICNYIDLPLQHASKSVLSSMSRPGGMEYYIDMIERLRKINPLLSIRSSFIVGYPGEDQNDFNILKDFLRTAKLNRVGFFAYSDEEGSDSYKLKNKIENGEIERRISELSDIQKNISLNNLNKLIGKELKCINDGEFITENEKELMVMRSEYDAPGVDGKVFVEINDENIRDSAFLNVKITSVKDYHDLKGEIIHM